jgi:hypothetical protein
MPCLCDESLEIGTPGASENRALAAASHGLCFVATRYLLPDLKESWKTAAPEVKLLRLPREAGVHLLETLCHFSGGKPGDTFRPRISFE